MTEQIEASESVEELQNDIGKIDQSLKSALLIADQEDKDLAVQNAARGFITLNQPDKAKEIVSYIISPYESSELLIEIGDSLRLLNRTDDALNTFDRAEKLALQAGEPWQR